MVVFNIYACVFISAVMFSADIEVMLYFSIAVHSFEKSFVSSLLSHFRGQNKSADTVNSPALYG